MSDVGRLAEVARERSQVYWFLSTFYTTRPDARFFADLAGRVATLKAAGTDSAGEGLNHLRSALDEPDAGRLAERLTVEYTRLFRGLSADYGPPPPYESLYRGSQLMGEVTAAVMARYADAGFGVIDEDLGPQDHIGAELKFMALLCHDENSAWERADHDAAARKRNLQRRFLAEHLLRWVPAYCQRIQEESVERFYIGATMLTEHAVIADNEVLGDLLMTTRTE